jgi:hypothetical protein
VNVSGHPGAPPFLLGPPQRPWRWPERHRGSCSHHGGVAHWDSGRNCHDDCAVARLLWSSAFTGLRNRSLKRDQARIEAAALIERHGDRAYPLARTLARHEQVGPSVDPFRQAGHWDRVRQEIRRQTGREATDTATRYCKVSAAHRAHAAEQDRPDVLKRRQACFGGQPDLDPERLVTGPRVRFGMGSASSHIIRRMLRQAGTADRGTQGLTQVLGGCYRTRPGKGRLKGVVREAELAYKEFSAVVPSGILYVSDLSRVSAAGFARAM